VRWAAPWAALLALTAILPIVAHLWSRRRPVSVPFPTLRFLRAASPVSRRLRRLQDWPLLALRLAIVAVICAAAAGPTLTSPWRRDAWLSRLHRIILVDAEVETSAARTLTDLRRDVASATTIPPGPVGEALSDAIALASRRAMSMRTEIVIVWDGSREALSRRDLAAVPADIGLRLVPIDPDARPRLAAGAATGASSRGLTIRAAASDTDARARLLASLPAIAATAMEMPIEVVWPGTPIEPKLTKAPADLRRVLDEIADDPRVREAAERSARDRRAPGLREERSAGAQTSPGSGIGRPGGRWLAQTADGTPLLRGWVDDTRLVLVLDAVPTSPLAWWSVVSALESMARPWRIGASASRWNASELAGAQREPATPATASLPGGLDTRMAWGAALALLVLEQWWRRVVPKAVVEVVDAA
jgi:hypothetical protein